MHPPQNKILNQKFSVDFNTILGKGATGNVYKGLSLEPYPHSIAVKVILLKEINNEVTSYLLQCQLQALKAIASSHTQSIIKLKQIIVVDQQCFIAMQLLQGGTLQDHLAKVSKIQEKSALIVLEQILQGYKLIKNNGIVHRDLKPSNVMFENKDTLTAKIIDFGYCKMQKIQNKPKMFYNVGSPRYMSPEAYKQNLYTEKSDIWSIGIIFYEMLTGSTLDKGKDIPETFQSIRERGIPIPSKLSKKSKRLLQYMLMYSPTKRATCEQILMFLHQDEFLPHSQIILDVKSEMKNETKLFPHNPQQSSEEKKDLPRRQDIRILSIQRKQSPQAFSSLNKAEKTVFSPNSNFKNKITFVHPSSAGPSLLIPTNNKRPEEQRKERISPENMKRPMLSFQKPSVLFTPKKQEKNFMHKSSAPVRINITTLQPSPSQQTLEQRMKSITKQNQTVNPPSHFFKSQISDHKRQEQWRQDRTQTHLIKNNFKSAEKKILNSPKKVFQNEYKLPFPQQKNQKDRVNFNFHHYQQQQQQHQQLKNSLELPLRSLFEPRSSTAHQINGPQRKTFPDLTQDETYEITPKQYLLPLRQTISNTPLR